MSMAKINHKIATNSRLILANFGGLLMGENISGIRTENVKND
jgi:hypothetical protein